MAKLYEITDDLLALNNLLENLIDEGGEPREPTEEEIEELKKWFDIAETDFKNKIDAYCKLIKNWQLKSDDAEAEKKNFKKESERLIRRANAYENKAKTLKTLLGWGMERLKIRKYETSLFSVQFQNTRGTVKTTFQLDTKKIPDEYLKPRELDTKAIEDGLKEGLLIQKAEPENYGKVFTKDGEVLEGVLFTKGEALYIR
jgi:hypothetical protein